MDYTELEVWKKSVDLADFVYDAAMTFPKDELYGLTSQIKRSVISIASNVAEGHDRHGTKEFIHFIGIARGSLAELETQMLLSKRRKFISEENYEVFFLKSREIAKMLWKLRQSLENKLK